MAYIGKSPSTKFSAAAKVDTFTGDGSTTTFDLANLIPAGGENGLQVFVNNVRQKPGASNAFTVGNDGSGDLKRITFTEAPAASDEIYVITTFEATNITEVGDGTIATAKIADDAVTSAKIVDGAIVNADINASAAIADSKLATLTTASKVNVSALSAPGSASVFLRGDRTYGAIPTDDIDTNAFNISLLGFKMAVNEGLTVFNLVDGIVDEFHDESGTDEAEGSNDTYCGTSDYYINSTSPAGITVCTSAGFTLTTITEPDTSTAGTNPGYGAGTLGAFTVPTGATSINTFLWGAGGGAGTSPSVGGGGGYSEGTIAVTGGQVLDVLVAEGGCRSELSEPQLSFGGGGAATAPDPNYAGAGGGASGIFNASTHELVDADFAPGGEGTPLIPAIFVMAGGGGGAASGQNGGAGGGLTGDAGSTQTEQTSKGPTSSSGGYGGGGDQVQGGEGGESPSSQAQSGGFLYGGNGGGPGQPARRSGGGGGFYGGGGGVDAGGPHGAAGGGSSYYGNPQVTSGATEEGAVSEGGGDAKPNYQPGTNTGVDNDAGNDGFVLITASAPATTLSTTIVSSAFTASSVPTTSRIVVFEENVATPTLNTDIIASISRDGGSNFTTATLTDSGYVTGSSGQRILTGQATISGQPSGQSMRWKLALANNAVKIHGVSLQWS